MDNLTLLDGNAYAASCKYYRVKADKALARPNTIILVGFNCKLDCHARALVIQQGATNGENTEKEELYRGMHEIKQIIILSNVGNVSLSALEWCHDQGISLVMLSSKGERTYSIVPDLIYASKLRRKQYALSDQQQLLLAQQLVVRKTENQLAVARRLTQLKDQANLIALLEETLATPLSYTDIHELQLFEGRLAAKYFASFVGLPILWETKDAKLVPPHWKTISERASNLSCNGTGRHATNPFHAALNYLYSITEHQLLMSCHMAGLDPACGVLHADQQHRPTLLYDLIEPLRALVDEKVLTLFSHIKFKRGDIMPTRTGEILFNADLLRYLVAMCRLTDAVVEEVVTSYKAQLLSV